MSCFHLTSKISFPCEIFLFSTTRCVHREKRIKSHHVLNSHGRYQSSSCPPLQPVLHNSPHPSLFGLSREFRPSSGCCWAIQGQASVLGVSAGLALQTTGGCLEPEIQQLHKVHSEIFNDLEGLARTEKKVILPVLWGNSAQGGAGDQGFTPCSKISHPWALSLPPSVYG